MKERTGKLWDKIGKDRLVILILMGLLLIVIAIPIEGTNASKNTDTNASKNTDTGAAKNDDIGSSKNTDASRSNVNASSNRSDSQLNNQSNEAGTHDEYADILAKKLQETLEYIEGVGKVKVFVSMKSSKELVVEKDTPYTRDNTTESDSSGGSRNVTNMNNEESTVYYTDSEGNNAPYVVKENAPLVEGIMVVAQGGQNKNVSDKITQALCALFGIDPTKVTILPMKNA